ncbi:hypothetical protein D1007_00160 [Hordeum vulgare]|nr:hypothetical protein D1007_00160 [Hordeum vulgare]
MEFINFDVVHIGLPYNVILGYSALAKFMVLTHHAYNTVKIPGCSGIITIRCAEKEVLHPIENAYKAPGTVYPTEKDDMEPPEAATMKKKLVFSQERVETKKVLLDDSGSGPTITVGNDLSSK